MARSRFLVCVLCPLVGLALVAYLILAHTEPEANAQTVKEAQPSRLPLDNTFEASVRPFLKANCLECHSGEKPKGDLDLSGFTNVDTVVKDLKRWETILLQLDTERMPPKKAQHHPTDAQRKGIVAWIKDLRKYEAKRNAGDPGPVMVRRLSNAEYDYTIRDLTGVDIRPAKEFPVDPTNEAGFDNSGESLAMSQTLVTKYMDAARKVSEYLLFTPDGLVFADYPVVAETDRDKYGVRQIIDFYKHQRTDYTDYFQAAWRYHYRKDLGQPNASLADIAGKEGISAKYLTTIYNTLTGPHEGVGPIAALQEMWKALPAPEGKPNAARSGCESMRTVVTKVREKLVPDVKNLTSKSMHNGSQPLVMWKNRTMAANRMRYAGGAAKMQLEKFVPANSNAAKLAMTAPTDAAALKKYEAGFTTFCATFPDAFYISERARVYLDPKGEKNLKGRLLNAGLHSQTGYFRDDDPLYELMLSKEDQKELDRLWLEFDVITGAPIRQYTSFLWFERSDSSFMRPAEFDFARPEDKEVTSEAKIKKLHTVFLARATKNGANQVVQKAIKDYFELMSAQIRTLEKARVMAEPKQLQTLQKFAERAFRRPLSPAERDGIVSFYKALRDKEGLSHDDAVRDVMVSVLVSPNFLFRIDSAVAGSGVQPLTDISLANRLSYFLWSTMPDAELLAHATSGDLHKQEVLLAQTKRMIQDKRIRALALEFGGNWLDFRRFEEHNAVDRQRFKMFTDDLRKAMFEEPVHFVMDVAQNNRSVLDFLYGKHTFVNPALAKHYGMPSPGGSANNWVKVEDARKFGRGGLLPMALFLTKNAPGLRTSPVKRGYWVVSKVLGEKIPPPPAEVPELPTDEAKLDLPLRDVLARHRADKACAGCHERFDAFGLAFEGYGPVGELRTKDLGGRLVETHAIFPGGAEGKGLDGLLTYVKDKRQDEFVDNFSRKLLAFALGRTLIPSDDGLIDEMRSKLAANDYRFSVLIEAIVTSPQFLKKRGQS